MHDDTEEKVAESVFVAFCFVPCLFAGWRDVHISGNDAAYRCFKGGGIGRNERKQRKGNGESERGTDHHTCADGREEGSARGDCKGEGRKVNGGAGGDCAGSGRLYDRDAGGDCAGSRQQDDRGAGGDCTAGNCRRFGMRWSIRWNWRS